jgi:stearoyl-CoA desaturase (delta-9 desaturase)
MSQATKIRNLQLVNHILTLLGISWVVYTSQWYLLGISLSMGFLFCVFGINIGYHRYITHQSFQTYPIIEKILLTIGCLCLLGSPLGWAISHINHHAYADKEGDPYSPHRLSLWDFLMTRFEPIKHQTTGARRLLRNKNVMFLQEYYFLPIALYCILLAIINPWLVIFAWSIPSLIALYLLLINNIVCHMYGYKNFDTTDESHNNILMSLITFGESWHNNHHANAKDWKQGLKWWEIDLTSCIIRLIKVNT